MLYSSPNPQIIDKDLPIEFIHKGRKYNFKKINEITGTSGGFIRRTITERTRFVGQEEIVNEIMDKKNEQQRIWDDFLFNKKENTKTKKKTKITKKNKYKKKKQYKNKKILEIERITSRGLALSESEDDDAEYDLNDTMDNDDYDDYKDHHKLLAMLRNVPQTEFKYAAIRDNIKSYVKENHIDIDLVRFEKDINSGKMNEAFFKLMRVKFNNIDCNSVTLEEFLSIFDECYVKKIHKQLTKFAFPENNDFKDSYMWSVVQAIGIAPIPCIHNLFAPILLEWLMFITKYFVDKFKKSGDETEDQLMRIANEGCYIVTLEQIYWDERIRFAQGLVYIHPIWKMLLAVHGKEKISVQEFGSVFLDKGAPPGSVHTDYNGVDIEGMLNKSLKVQIF